MPKPLVMSGFRRRRDFAKARDLLVRLCVDAPAGRRASLNEAARRARVSPARAWRMLEPALYARFKERDAYATSLFYASYTAMVQEKLAAAEAFAEA